MKHERIAGNWVLEWQDYRPNTIWVVSNHKYHPRRSQSAIQYDDGSFGWDYTPDKNVELAVTKFMREIRDVAGVA